MSTGELCAGDILIAQELDGAFSSEMDANFVRAGQAAFSHFGPSTTASATSEHVVMITDDGTQKNVESASKGVVVGHWLTKRKYLVYRYTGSDDHMPFKAVGIGMLLAADDLTVKEDEGFVKYAGYLKVAASVFRRKKAGHFASKRIERILELCDDLQSGKKTRADLRKENLKMICSEFVATCYEVAAYKSLGKGLLNVDPRAMTAKALEATLNGNSDFTLQGVYTGKVNVDEVNMSGLHYLTAEIIFRELSEGNKVLEIPPMAINNEKMKVKTTCSLLEPFKLQHSLHELKNHDWEYQVDNVAHHAPSQTTGLKEVYEITYSSKGYEIVNRIEAPKNITNPILNSSST